MPILSLATHLALFTRGAHLKHVAVVPDLEPERVAGARGYASFGGETPLALIDDTEALTGAAGALVTDQAIYFSNPPSRLPLAAVIDVPKYPRGEAAPGVLETKGGVVPLGGFAIEEARKQFHRVMNAISRANLGSTDEIAMAVPLADTPVAELMRRHLVARAIELPVEILGPHLRVLALRFAPIDVVRGEEIFGFVDESFLVHREGLLVTSERFVYRRGDERRIVPFWAIRGVELHADRHALVLRGDRESAEIVLSRRPGALAPIAAFVEAMVRTVPAEQRVARWPSLAKKGDPSGAMGMIAYLPAAENRGTALCTMVSGAVRHGMPAPVGEDFARRIHVAIAAIARGHGEHEGFAVSCLPGRDLAFALHRSFGRPLREGPIAGGYAIDFAFDGAAVGAFVERVANDAIGVGLTGAFTDAWKAPPPTPVTDLHVELREIGGLAGFRVTTTQNGRPVSLLSVSPAAHAFVESRLAETELTMLLLRIVLGWGPPPDALFATPLDAVLAAAKPMSMMRLDPRAFGLGGR